MQYFNEFYRQIAVGSLSHWLETLPAQLSAWYKEYRHGDFSQWEKSLSHLPQTQPSTSDTKQSVTFGSTKDISAGEAKKITHLLSTLHPWRKGPFNIHGIHIDTEWRSDWKWDRVNPHISSLKNRTVLDVGCGSGYHLWRMQGEGAALTVGIDPSDLFLAQFLAIRHFSHSNNVHLLPLGIEQLPNLQAFDTVFSMGVLYHRRSPIDFLHQLKQQLRMGGELVLETLVVDGDENTVLVPGERYAKMRNVWFIPSTLALEHWLKRVGFSNIRLVDENVTSCEEQRRTDWMQTESLADFLDPEDSSKTIEGYPAPKRAVFVATR